MRSRSSSQLCSLPAGAPSSCHLCWPQCLHQQIHDLYWTLSQELSRSFQVERVIPENERQKVTHKDTQDRHCSHASSTGKPRRPSESHTQRTNFLWPPCWHFLPTFNVFSPLALSSITAAARPSPFHPWSILPFYQALPTAPPQVKPRQRDPGGSSSYWRNKPFEQMCVITKMGPAGKAEVFITHLACSPGPRHPHSAALLFSRELGTCPPEDPQPALLCPLLLPPGLTLICPPLPCSQHTSYV